MSDRSGVPRFHDQVAVVTGGTSGIGLAIVRRLLAEHAVVVIGGRNTATLRALADEFGDQVATQQTDVRTEEDVESLVDLASRRFGKLTLGFNVAGVGGGAMISEQTEEEWDLVVDTCLKGVFFSMKHEARAMLAQGTGGAIVNVSSLNSTVPMFFGSAYCSAKAGVAMLSQCGALEWATGGIRVNAVSPGLTATPMTESLVLNPALKQEFMDRIPLNRVGVPDDQASAALFLASDEASYISGTNLFVDGAWAQTGYPDLRPHFAEKVS